VKLQTNSDLAFARSGKRKVIPLAAWAWVLGIGLLLLEGFNLRQTLAATAAQFTGNYYYVERGGNISKVEADPRAIKAPPEYWSVYHYKRGEIADGSSKGRWVEESKDTLPALLDMVKGEQKYEINNKDPSPSVADLTYLNAFFPVAHYDKSDTQTKPPKKSGGTGSPEEKKNGVPRKLPWPDQGQPYAGLLTLADKARTARAWLQQLYSDMKGDPLAKVGNTVKEHADELAAAIARVEKLQRDLDAGLIISKEQFREIVDEITKSLSGPLKAYENLKNAPPYIAAPSGQKPEAPSEDEYARQLNALSEQFSKDMAFDPNNPNATLAKLNALARQMVRLMEEHHDPDRKQLELWLALMKITNPENTADAGAKFQQLTEKMMSLTQ